MSTADDVWTYRPTSRFVAAGVAWALLAGLLASRWADEGLQSAARLLPLAVALGDVAWLLLWLPRVDVSRAAVRVVNPTRTTTVPWPALVEVQTQYAFTLVMPGASVRAWAAPGPSRHQAIFSAQGDLTGLPTTAYDSRGSVSVGDLPQSPSGAVALHVRRVWQDLVENDQLELGVADETPVGRDWHVVPIAVGVVALLVAVAAAVV